jgi:hypothetical protein
MRRQRFSLLATAPFVSQVSALQPSDASAGALARDTAFNKKSKLCARLVRRYVKKVLMDSFVGNTGDKC